ncbi:MAG: 2-alkenal reductase [Gemmataceae bacterium]
MSHYYRPGSAYRIPWALYVPTLLALAILAGILLWRFWLYEPRLFDPDAQPRAVTARGDLAADEKATIELFRSVSPCVVHIDSIVVQHDFFTLDPIRIREGSGSGFIWSDDGYVVTNYHVIARADEPRVILADRSEWPARVVGVYPPMDLAVLKINAPKSKLKPIPIGTSGDLQVGQKAFAIGNPFGLDQTLTMGIISALGRELENHYTGTVMKGLIQTDAAINPGNSGGPLLDSAGRLIGVNTAIISPSGANAGIGFAIPVDQVNRIVPQIIRHGRYRKPGLGVQLAPDQWVQDLGLEGAMILEVLPGSPAERAGLRPLRRSRTGRVLGDIIVAVDDNPVRKVEDLLAALDHRKAGDTIRLTILRDGEKITVEVTLEEIG